MWKITLFGCLYVSLVSEKGHFIYIVCLFSWYESLWAKIILFGCLYVSLVSENGRFIYIACLVGLVMLN